MTPFSLIFPEDLLKDIQAESKKIFNFLDINKSTALSSPLVKINSGKLKDIIENYDEIEMRLNKTPYEQYLY